MADDLVVSTSAGGPTSSVPDATRFSLEEVTTLNGGVVTAQLAQRIILALRTANATAVDITAAAPLPVSLASGPLPTDAATQTTLELIRVLLAAGIPLDAATLAALESITVGGTVELGAASLAALESITASGPLTDTQLRAAAVPVSAASLPLPSGAATEATLVAVGLLVDGLATAAETQPVSLASVPSHAVTGPLTDTELRATAVPVTANAGTNLNTSALATSAKQDTLLTELQAKADLTETQPVSLASVPSHAVTNAGTFAVQAAAAASELHLGEVGGKTVAVGVERTRPADTTAYAALDAVADSTSAPTSITFAGASRVASGSGYIVKARLVTDQAACVAQMRLWLYNAAPNTLQNDNAAFLIKYADKATKVGYIDFPALSTEAGSDCAQSLAADIRLAYVADASSQLLGVLQTRTAFTPANAQKIYVTLSFEQN